MKTRKSLTKKIIIAAFMSASFASISQASMLLGDAERGKQLHDAKCTGCHISKFGGDGSGMYTRSDHRVSTIEGLTGQVHNCNAMTKADLSDDDIDDIIKYLSDTYYKFDE